MIGNYILVQGSKISGHFSGPIPDSPLPDGSTVVHVPDFWDTSGEDLREYDKDLSLRPLADRIADSLVAIDPHWKAVGERIEPKTVPELVRDGLVTRPPGLVLDKNPDGNPILRAGTIVEQVANGDMTQATADIINAVNVRAERDALLAGCDWIDTVSAQTRIPAAQMQQWLTYRQALRDLTKQGGFPSGAISWPVPPSGVTP
jgi:hypothetical protein